MVRAQITPPSTEGASHPESVPFAVDVSWPAARIAVLRPCGELDLATVPQFAARLDELLLHPPRGLVVDLSGLRFLAVQALSEFVRLHGRVMTDPRLRVRLACAPHQVARLLRLSGVGLMFDMQDTVQAAVDSLVVQPERGADPRVMAGREQHHVAS